MKQFIDAIRFVISLLIMALMLPFACVGFISGIIKKGFLGGFDLLDDLIDFIVK